MVDAVLLALFAVAFIFNNNMRPVLWAYALCVIYQITLFDHHSAVINHVIYGLIFIPFCYFATIKLAAAMLVYSTFQLFVSIDYYFYRYSDTIISASYNETQIILALCLILIGLRKVDNGINNQFNWHDNPRLVNIWNNQTHSQKKG